jgi:hypothetical protein
MSTCPYCHGSGLVCVMVGSPESKTPKQLLCPACQDVGLRAEVARLRTALRSVADALDTSVPEVRAYTGVMDYSWPPSVESAISEARAALERKL